MNVQIVLDSPWTSYTSLDYLRGRVILNLPTPVQVSSIVCKLEGESRTRLMHPGNPQTGDRPRPLEETHKVLYKLATLLPNDRIDTQFAGYQKYYLLQGHAEYPFEFKLPFNNSCHAAPPAKDLSFAGFKLEVTKAPTEHIKSSLPPTVTAHPGVAEIRYFVKITVNRKEFYKENPRVYQLFNFIPIEPPRPAASSAETYARRQHQFLSGVSAPPPKLKSLFGKSKSSAHQAPVDLKEDAPKIQLDARLPSPAIVTCNRDLPLRIILKRLTESSTYLYLQSIQIELISHTRIRAHDIYRTESNSWIIVSHSNMGVLLDSGNESGKSQLEKEILVDSNIWKNKPVPNNVAPTFDACNMSRKYDLQIRVGLSHGDRSGVNVVILPLQLSVAVYSGIEPPAALVEAMQQAEAGGKAKPRPVTKKPLPPQAAQNVAAAASASQGPAPAPLPPDEEEPPPSYEDAIAQDIGPVDGPRNYQPPPPQAGGFSVDNEKRR